MFKGDLTYVSNGLTWRVEQPDKYGEYFAAITDAVPVGFKQPSLHHWVLFKLLEDLDKYKLEPKREFETNVSKAPISEWSPEPWEMK